MSLLADIVLVIRAVFLFLGSLGLIRMPDVYTCMQASTKAVTLGALTMLAGIGVFNPAWWPKLLIIGLFILLTSPVGASTIARAARISGLVPWQLPEDREDRTEADPKDRNDLGDLDHGRRDAGRGNKRSGVAAVGAGLSGVLFALSLRKLGLWKEGYDRET